MIKHLSLATVLLLLVLGMGCQQRRSDVKDLLDRDYDADRDSDEEDEEEEEEEEEEQIFCTAEFVYTFSLYITEWKRGSCPTYKVYYTQKGKKQLAELSSPPAPENGKCKVAYVGGNGGGFLGLDIYRNGTRVAIRSYDIPVDQCNKPKQRVIRFDNTKPSTVPRI